jgi:hypothetical protein
MIFILYHTNILRERLDRFCPYGTDVFPRAVSPLVITWARVLCGSAWENVTIRLESASEVTSL